MLKIYRYLVEVTIHGQKRASLKGKGVGGSEEKGKGIDLLFGAAAEGDEPDAGNLVIDATAEAPEAATTRSAPPATPVPPPPAPAAAVSPPAPPSSPMATTAEVDEFGFPVASESPPPDLELASAAFAEPLAPSPSEAPPEDLDLSGLDLDAPPAPTFETALPDLPPDLANMPIAGEGPPADLDPLSSLLDDLPDSIGESDLDTDESAAPLPPDDLSLSGIDLGGLEGAGGLPGDGGNPDLGLGGDPIINEPPGPDIGGDPFGTGLPGSGTDPFVFDPPVSDPPIAPPISQPPTGESPIVPNPGSYGPAIPTPPMVAVPRARIESVSGIATEKIYVDDKDILPEDTKFGGTPDSGILTIAERAQVEQNELITQRVTRYIGRERREKLDREIEELYGEVATELSANKEDSEFALRVLSKAQDIIFEDARQYDEALYRVAVVRTMITRKRNLRKWSYTWGTAVFFYAVVWLVAFIFGFLSTGAIGSALDSSGSLTQGVSAVAAAWFSALAGGVGGVVGILYSLYWKVAMKQNFDRQYVMYYAVQPIIGFVLGAVMYFIIGAGFLVVNFATEPNDGLADTTANVLASEVVIALQIVVGWIAGFRVRFTLEIVDKVVQRFSGKGDGGVGGSGEPESVALVENRDPIIVAVRED